MTKLIFAFRNFANAPKNKIVINKLTVYLLIFFLKSMFKIAKTVQ